MTREQRIAKYEVTAGAINLLVRACTHLRNHNRSEMTILEAAAALEARNILIKAADILLDEADHLLSPTYSSAPTQRLDLLQL